MFTFATSSLRMNEIRPLPVGVFEDDALLLGLAARSRFAASGCLRTVDLLNSDDIAFEAARWMDAKVWDL